MENELDLPASPGWNRRTVLKAGVAMAGASLVSATASALPLRPASVSAPARHSAKDRSPAAFPGRRTLGRGLEVSSIGLGCQEMAGPLYGVVPRRDDMVALARRAFDHGVTLFDTAEAYGPHEGERIVGEALAPFRNQVVIESKFGWNIDLKTGQRLPGLNSRPEHIKAAVDGMLQRLRTDRIDLLYQHRVDPNVPIEDVVRAWAKRKEATLAQVSLAFLLAQKPWIVPIPGTTKTRHLLENLGADDVRFTPEEFQQFNAELSRITIAGARLQPAVLAFSGVEAPAKK